MDEHLTHEQLVGRIQQGEILGLETPGLREAAREVFLPLIEQMRGKEIIYRCRVPWLMDVKRLRVDAKGFRAKATPVQQVRDAMLGKDMDRPLTFSSSWEGLNLMGKSIGLFMLTDHFYTDQDVVAEVKAAAARNAMPKEISEILRRAREA